MMVWFALDWLVVKPELNELVGYIFFSFPDMHTALFHFSTID